MKRVRRAGMGMAALGLMAGLFGMGRVALADEIAEAQAQLNEIIGITRRLEPFVEQLDEASLIAIRRAAERVSESIRTVRLGHVQTMQLYQNFLDLTSTSTSFFREIATDATEGLVLRLQALCAQIERERGFDRKLYSQKVANLLEQQHRLLRQLKDATALPEELRHKMESLTAPLAKAIAVARMGDRPRAYKAGDRIHDALVALYPEFSEIQRSNAAFEVIMEIQGLNERYADLAQIGERDEPIDADEPEGK